MHAPAERRVLVTGATGYIGGRLLRPLLAAGHTVRAGARRPEVLAARAPDRVEVVHLDTLDEPTVRTALEGIDVAFYLVHSLNDRRDYAENDRRAARVFADAARDAGVGRIVYVGGLGRADDALSRHLASRQEVGRVLASTGVQTLEFRASIVIGSGSTSFEMIRNLVEKLPIMPVPRRVRQPTQPIAIEDLLAYLTAAVTLPVTGDRTYEIGGAEVTTYDGVLREYARQRGLKRLLVSVPMLSPRLSALWFSLFTPLHATISRRLAESLRHPTVVTDDAARRDFPDIAPRGMTEAFQRAFTNEDREFAETRWCDALGSCSLTPAPERVERAGRLIDSRTIRLTCPPDTAFSAISCIGGSQGWYAFDMLWDLRGWLDQLLGGVGVRRGRRDPSCVLPGDTLDFWRVVAIERPWRLELEAEMRMPGRGWLVYEVDPDPKAGGSIVRQTAIFDSKGLFGRAYWYMLVPFHAFVFNGTLTGIERECARL